MHKVGYMMQYGALTMPIAMKTKMTVTGIAASAFTLSNETRLPGPSHHRASLAGVLEQRNAHSTYLPWALGLEPSKAVCRSPLAGFVRELATHRRHDSTPCKGARSS